MLIAYLERRRFFLLFLFLLGVLLCYPYADGTTFGLYTFRTFACAMTLLALYAVSFRRSMALFGVALAIPAMMNHLRIFRVDASLLSTLVIGFNVCFDVLALVVIFRRVFVRGKADSEAIFGALCVYMFLGLTFASLYQFIEGIHPHTFLLDPVLNSHMHPDRIDFLYYSYGTMTSLGAPGIMALTPEVRIVTVIESMLGVLYLAVLISRLMGSYRGPAHRAEAAEGARRDTTV